MGRGQPPAAQRYEDGDGGGLSPQQDSCGADGGQSGETIVMVESFKFLGITMSNYLS